MKRFLLLLFALGALAYGALTISRSTTFQLFGEIVPRVVTDGRVVALTLDDGPTPKHIDGVLETLAQKEVRATFFLMGELAQKYPDLVHRIAEAGHEIGNHSYTHPRMVLMRPSQVAWEIEQTDAALQMAGAGPTPHFRPPFGKKLITLPWYLSRNDRASIMWDIAPEEWDGSIDARIERVKQEIRPGSIILLHVMYEANHDTRRMLAPLIDTLKADGYRFVTVSELRGAQRD